MAFFPLIIAVIKSQKQSSFFTHLVYGVHWYQSISKSEESHAGSKTMMSADCKEVIGVWGKAPNRDPDRGKGQSPSNMNAF